MLWWSWVGYSWLTSVVDPEEGAVRLTIFAAMAALLVAALCVPTVFDDTALLFAATYAVVRVAQIVLFVLASRDDPGLRHSVIGLAVSTAIGTGLLVVASFADGALQGAIWALALGLDMGGPLIIETEGWRLEPHHFAERHGLIVLIALGESIVAIGVGAEAGVDAGVVTAAVIGTIVSAALFWLYFDVVALVARRRLENAAPGRERNEIARDSFSYLHFPMVAGHRPAWPSASRRRSATSATSSRSCRPPRCSAARRSTCWPTSPSAGATCTASAASGSSRPSCAWR